VKLWQLIILAGIGILGVGYVYLHRVDLGLVRPASLDADNAPGGDSASPLSHPARINWEFLDRSPDGFKVEMPAGSKQLQVPANNEHGGIDEVNMLLANANAETTFAVAWADDPPVARENDRSAGRILDMARDDAMERTQTSLTSETRNTIGGYPARDFSARNPSGGILNSRLIYVSPRLYMLIAAFPSANARRQQDVTRFFDSFVTVSQDRAPETSAATPATQ
jgi:hypothetical protein